MPCFFHNSEQFKSYSSRALRSGVISPERILPGLPHPSGANAERIAYFLGRKTRSALSAKTDAVKLDTVREALTARVLQLKAPFKR